MPSMDVDSVDGLIEKSPLQVAGALMLPAAVFYASVCLQASPFSSEELTITANG